MADKNHNAPVSDVSKGFQSRKLTDKRSKLVKSKIRYMESLSPRDFPVSGIKAPPGFKALSMSQALWVYSQPLMYLVPTPEDISKADDIFEIGATIWNATINNLPAIEKKSDQEILAMIQDRLGLDKNRAKKLFLMMLRRKQYLFPNYIQPKRVRFVFISKERTYLINRFDYESLELTDDPIPPDNLDLELVQRLERLDRYTLGSANYDEYEGLLLKVQGECSQRFGIWLHKKGIKKQEGFSFFIDVYVSFIYANRHKEPITLQSRPGDYIIEFMVFHLLSKTSIEPWEYTLCPSAIRLFYKFLHEKGYLTHPPNPTIDYVDRMETYFLDILGERFS